MPSDRNREPYRPMESSGVMLFRVVVMLSCLILVPLAAIFGSAFPDVVKTQLVDRIKSLAGLGERSDSGTPPTLSIDVSQPDSRGVQPASWHSPEAAPDWQPAASQANAHQADYTAAAPAPPQTPPAPATTNFNAAPRVVDHFTEIQQRLREYGATNYTLSDLKGAANKEYCFRCTMLPPGATQPQQFEATDRDSLQAMAKVLGQVEAWRSNFRNQPNGPAVGDGNLGRDRSPAYPVQEPQNRSAPYPEFDPQRLR
jgi:hypothetical protein